MKRVNTLRDQRGMTMVELIVAVGMLGIVIGTASTYFAQMNSQSNIEQLKELQIKIGRDIEANLVTPDAIKVTSEFAGNEALNDCLTPGRTCRITEPPGSSITIFNASVPPETVAGPAQGYDFDGKPCTIGMPRCIFNPQVKFWATCPLGAGNRPTATCTAPVFLNFKYQIDNVHKEKSSRMKQIGSYPKAGVLTSSDTTFVTRLRVADVLARTGGTCGAGLMLTGFDTNGKPKCECLVQETRFVGGQAVPQFHANGDPVCGTQACPAGSLMIGFRLDTRTVKGVKRNTIVPDCRTEAYCSEKDTVPAGCPCKIVDLSTDGDCGPGFWMVNITQGLCEGTHEKHGKAAPETVKCSQKKGRCCSFELQ